MKESLERWSYALERRGVKVSRCKTESSCVTEREAGGNINMGAAVKGEAGGRPQRRFVDAVTEEDAEIG